MFLSPPKIVCLTKNPNVGNKNIGIIYKMKIQLFLSTLLFLTFCEGVPVALAVAPTTPSTTPAPVVSGKLVEKYIDDISHSLKLDHDKALKLVKQQENISISKKQKVDLLNKEFQSLSAKLSNITQTYNIYRKERNVALSDYDSFMQNFKKVEAIIIKNKTDYENEMKFLMSIKDYIRKAQKSKC